MKVFRIVLSTVVVLLAIFIVVGSRKNVPVSYAYNPTAEVTATGIVQEVEEFYCPVTEDRGAHLRLKTDKDTVMVHVAIARFLRAHQFVFRPGERIEVVGSKVKFQGEDTLIAREITRGKDKFIFRDANGNPVWSGE